MSTQTTAMPYVTKESSEAVVLMPRSAVTSSIVWLHGLGADGYDFVPIAEELQLPDALGVKFIFPHARQRAVTINNGFVMRAWYDIRGRALTTAEDEAGVRESDAVVRQLIDAEIAGGVSARNIIVAGFSQGGAIALYSGLRYPQRLAGILALSTYLPLRDSLPTEASPVNRETPILMCHGSRDQVVPEIAGQLSRDLLMGLGYAVQWKSYLMEHQVCMEEVADIAVWLKENLRRNK
jgi:phospholipase/carboxylesterase